jgi:presenilin-like A22 family membrane protease
MNFKAKEIFFLFFVKTFLFCTTLALGIFCALRLEKFLKIQTVEIPSFSLFQFIFYFFLSTIFIFLIYWFLKGKTIKRKVYKILFVFISFFSSLIFFESFLGEPLSLILVFFLILWWLKNPIVLNQNLLMVFSLAGVGAGLGLSLKPESVIVILIILSVYDFIAVYKTKHMVKIAKDMMESGAILGLIFPLGLHDFLKSTNEVKPGEGKFLILGGGDVAFPLIFSISLLSLGIFQSLAVALFSLFGIFVNFLLLSFQKERKPIPALPLITFFSLVGYFLVKFYA